MTPEIAAGIIGLTAIALMAITVNTQAKKFWREIERMHENMNNEDS